MGNRAVICFEEPAYVQDKATKQYKPKGTKVLPYAIYLHWNGGPESVYAFLAYANQRFTDRGGDIPYFSARFTEFVGRYFENSNTSLGLLSVDPKAAKAIIKNDAKVVDVELSHGDNGVYVIGYHEDTKHYAITRRFEGERGFNLGELVNEQRQAVNNERYQGILDEVAYRNGVHPDKEEAEKAA